MWKDFAYHYREALTHPNADEDVLNSYFCLNGVVDDPALASALLKQFPWGQYPEVWARIKEDSQWSRTLLSCPETPQAFLVWMAWEQRQFAEFDGSWSYAYEVGEEICRHAQVDAEVFGILMDDEGFIENDYWRDFGCLRIISEHPKASIQQKAEALAQIQKQMDEGREEE
ncbi:hypothetical protein [Deinococcus sp. SL84]|uniref:hypothetical protein n=1 Tax=Deinococcus sp. SL84 TaxID=2994663 RepID=UPI002273D425|nr:hypothetical protein [Deinococcus sp. SL84]MCY1704282.1 hypothetical protein [Deinococcus sp. SL84]